jgi:hypothetical protein
MEGKKTCKTFWPTAIIYVIYILTLIGALKEQLLLNGCSETVSLIAFNFLFLKASFPQLQNNY